MVDLSEFLIPPDPTLEEMRRQSEKIGNSEPPRKYIGASSLGEECSRKIWYGYNGYPSLPIESQGLYAIEDGHRTETLIASRLRLVPGIELWTEDENGKPFGFSDLDGKYRGHVDGVIKGLLQAPITPAVWECKAVNVKKFEKFQKAKSKFGEKSALENWDFIYFVQAQIYMYKLELTRHYLTVATPGGRDIDSCRTELNLKFAKEMDAKALRIINAKEPPTKIGEKDSFVCKWCRHRGICHD